MEKTAVVSKCSGCDHIVKNVACRLYARPWAKQHILGGCASKTNRVVAVVNGNGVKIRIGQQKQKKAAK